MNGKGTETPTITITDQKCKDCGKEGALEKTGRCLTCQAAAAGLGTMANWPDDEEKFCAAVEVEKIARRLMSMRKELWLPEKARIYYRFRKEMSGDKAGECRLVSNTYRDLIDYDYIITVDWSRWKTYNQGQKDQLVYHELCHIDLKEGGSFGVAKHDFEGFVNEWILYNDLIKADSNTGRIFSRQMKLFDDEDQREKKTA